MQEIQMARKTAAYKIHMDIMAAGEVAAEAFSTFCRLLKTMRDDKLYQELEYSSFEAYCENAVGLKQSQAYNYIKALEDFGDEKFQSIGKLGIRKLQLIGTVPKEQREEFMTDNNLEEMTTRQVEAKTKEFKAKLEADLKKAQEWGDMQAKYAGEHMNRARQAEFDLEKKSKAMELLKSDLEYAKKQLSESKKPQAEVQMSHEQFHKLEDVIHKKEKEIETLQKQLHDKPIEIPAVRVVEKTVIPDEVRIVIYNKVAALYEGLLKLTKTEIQIFAQDVDPDYFDDVVQGISDAIGVLNNIDTAVFEAQQAQQEAAPTKEFNPECNCGICKHANMDGVTDEELDNDKTRCTITDEVVDFEHNCSRFEDMRG
jgi:hypothetical protein